MLTSGGLHPFVLYGHAPALAAARVATVEFFASVRHGRRALHIHLETVLQIRKSLHRILLHSAYAREGFQLTAVCLLAISFADFFPFGFIHERQSIGHLVETLHRSSTVCSLSPIRTCHCGSFQCQSIEFIAAIFSALEVYFFNIITFMD